MKQTAVWLIHLGYWTLFILLLMSFFFFAVFVPAYTHRRVPNVISMGYWLRLMTGFAILPGLFTFYSCYFYLFNHYLRLQRYTWFIITSLIAAVTASCIGTALASTPLLFGPAFLFGDGYASALVILLIMIVVAWINGLIGAVIRACLTWFSEIRLKEELHRKNMETELALVKSQIDPHFLFNTLNNIDVLISRDATAASVYLNKLSGIMRFLLYETKNEKVELQQEVEYLHQYIDLQKIRTSNRDYVDLQVSGDLSGQLIAPMILLPFIENAFKHTQIRKASSSIKIHLHCRQGKLSFTCTNTLHPESETNSKNSGMGNLLINKRLELLYPNTHSLTTNCHAQLYQVKLDLEL